MTACKHSCGDVECLDGCLIDIAEREEERREDKNVLARQERFQRGKRYRLYTTETGRPRHLKGPSGPR